MTISIVFVITDHPPSSTSPCVEHLKDDGTTDGPPVGAVGVSRVVFPSQEYRSAQAGDSDGERHRPRYQTAPVLPRGDDGGFAERFLEGRRGS